MDTSPFDDIRSLLDRLPPAQSDAAQAVRARIGAAGELDPDGAASKLSQWLAQWSGRSAPDIRKPLVAIFAGSHGIAAHGVSMRSAADVVDTVQQCQSGTAAINRLCTRFDLGLKVFDLALDMPTVDFTIGPALDERGCAATMAFGMEALAEGADAVCLGAFGAGAATASAALLCALHGGVAADWLDPTTPAVDSRRSAVVETALAEHRDMLADPLEAMRRLGGREFAAIAGAILAARFQSVPIVLEGPVALVSALLLERARSGAATHCMVAARPATPRLQQIAREAGLQSVISDGFGSLRQEPLDGALALSVLKSATVATA